MEKNPENTKKQRRRNYKLRKIQLSNNKISLFSDLLVDLTKVLRLGVIPFFALIPICYEVFKTKSNLEKIALIIVLTLIVIGSLYLTYYEKLAV